MPHRAWTPPQRGALAAALVGGLALGCTHVPQRHPPAPEPVPQDVYRRAETDRNERLEIEVQRLRADLRQAEESLVMAESGLRGETTRADAVSLLAEARIQVETAGQRAPWRRTSLREADAKLEEADRQLGSGHFGSAIFFASRAQRIADELMKEAAAVAKAGGVLFVTAPRVNLRAGPSTEDAVIGVLMRDTPVFPEQRERRWLLVRTPSGRVGWVHEALLGSDSSS